MKRLKGKYAVFLDIDGTLIDKSPMPSKRVVEAVRKAQKAGHKIFLDTGRGRGKIEQEMLDLLKPDGIVSAMGQYIEMDGNILRCVCLEYEDVQLMEEIVSKRKFEAFYEGVYKTYRVPGSVNKGWSLENYDQPEGEEKKRLLKLCGIGRLEDEDVKRLKKRHDVFQHPEFFETVIKGYSKSEGMSFVLKRLGIPKENSIAMGDSANDADMIECAGVGVAMGNATLELKKIADYITDTNENDGVATALEALLEM